MEIDKLNKFQLTCLVILRLAIGWHFLYEGLIKFSNPHWTSYAYLMDSKGIFSTFFKLLAENEGVLKVVDFLNIWGLILIGLALILGILSRFAIISGILLLAFYYLSHPALLGQDYIMPREGSYFIVNKTLIELFALAVLYVFPTSKIIGIDHLIWKK